MNPVLYFYLQGPMNWSQRFLPVCYMHPDIWKSETGARVTSPACHLQLIPKGPMLLQCFQLLRLLHKQSLAHKLELLQCEVITWDQKRMADTEWTRIQTLPWLFSLQPGGLIGAWSLSIALSEYQKIYFSSSVNSTLLFLPQKPWLKPSSEEQWVRIPTASCKETRPSIWAELSLPGKARWGKEEMQVMPGNAGSSGRYRLLAETRY